MEVSYLQTQEDKVCICHKCNKGILTYINVTIMTVPVKYKHHCTNCGHIESLETIYSFHHAKPN